MKQEYLEELISLSNKDTIITKELIEKIVNDIVEEYKFNGVIFGDTNWSGNVMCTCDINSKNIIVNYEKIIKEYNSLKRNSLQKNLIILSYLFHEFNHLKEESILKTLSFESLLISYSTFDIFLILAEAKLKHLQYLVSESLYKRMLEKRQENLYHKIYDKIPGERIAYIRSHKQVFETIYNYPGFSEKYKDDLIFINSLYRDQYYLGYNNYNKSGKYYPGPLLDYLKFIEMPDLLDSYGFYSLDTEIFLDKSSKEFTIEERMLYGLPVTLQETDELDKKLILTK